MDAMMFCVLRFRVFVLVLGLTLLFSLAGLEACRHETLPLGHFRSAQRVLLTLTPPPSGDAGADAAAAPRPHRVWLVNTHLHHGGGGTPSEQARQRTE
jgi:hypothetical protein